MTLAMGAEYLARDHTFTVASRRATCAPHHEAAADSVQCDVRRLTSGVLALGLGGVFRICLADDAIAAVALGGVEAGIGALDQRIGIVARLQHGNADRDGNAPENFASGFFLQFLRHHSA